MRSPGGWRATRACAACASRRATAGTPAVAETVPDLDILDPAAVARHAARERYDLVVIGPEAPLAAGVADALRQASVPVFGPTRAAARLESSKAFAKEQLGRAGVPTAASAVFDDLGEALAHARASEQPAGGQGRLAGRRQGRGRARQPRRRPRRPSAPCSRGAPPGARLLLEERLEGREVSAFALVSDESVVPLARRATTSGCCDGDEGPNTGGMGAYSAGPMVRSGGDGAGGGRPSSSRSPGAWPATGHRTAASSTRG